MGNTESKLPGCFSRMKECVGKRGGQAGNTGPIDPKQVLKLRQVFAQAGQEHVFDHFDEVHEAEQRHLLSQAECIDPAAVLSRYERTVAVSKDEMTGSIEPCEPTRLDLAGQAARAEWNQLALDAISKGEVGVILLAGGQGTRLGFGHPKGCFPGLDPVLLEAWIPSGKTLFCLQAQRILRLQRLASENTGVGSATIQWYIMTSPQTHQKTETNLHENMYYGLKPEQVHLFQQGTLPCLSMEGKKFLMSAPSEIATAPDGNGGIYAALHKSGMIDHMKQHGVQYLFTNAVDNCVCKIADPLFMGFCIKGRFKAGNKVTEKRTADEKVGVQCIRNGAYQVVEYSDIDESVRDLRDEASGKLKFSSGSVCIHYYSLDFLDKECHPTNLATALMYHIARKKIPYWDNNDTQLETPTEPNGIKLETFIFDVFKLAGPDFGVFEVQRDEEFAPIKNKSVTADNAIANDSPVSASKQMSQFQKRWLVEAGAKLVDVDGNDVSQNDEVDVEISPLVSYGGEGLAEIVNGKTLVLPCMLVEKGFFIVEGSRCDFPYRAAEDLGNGVVMYSSRPQDLHVDE